MGERRRQRLGGAVSTQLEEQGGQMEICRSCSECRFWDAQRIQGKGPDISGVGYCRRSFPQVSDRLVERHFTQGLTGCELAAKCSFWPASLAGDSCGEFQSKIMEVPNG